MRPFQHERFVNDKFFGQINQPYHFAEPYRYAVTDLANHSNALQDLLHSFPCLLFALATGYGDLAARREAYYLIEKGASLKEIAKKLNVPWWMRKLPPEAFSEPLKGPLPDGEEFSRHIVNLIPKDTHATAIWLDKVIRSYQLCNEAFALWVAENKSLYIRDDGISHDNAYLELLASWSWHSQQAEAAAHHLIRNLWHKHINVNKAVEAAKTWYNRVKLIIYLGDKGIEDCWLQGGTVLGFDFVPLRTAEDFLLEAELMGNCLDQYADQICFQRVRVFSIRQNGIPVANLEIGPHEDDRSMPNLEQLRGPENCRVNSLVWRAVYAWMGSQNFVPKSEGPSWTSDIRTEIKQHPIWNPYRHFLSQKHIDVTNLAILNLDQAEKLLLQLNGLALLEGS